MKRKTQLQWVITELKENKKVSRNNALAHYITRLSGYISKLKEEGWNIEGKYVRYEKGLDYRYYLLEIPTKTVLKPRFNRNEQETTVTMIPTKIPLF